MKEAIEKNDTYGRYRELGGFTNEKDYENALLRKAEMAQQKMKPDKHAELQVQLIAELAGIELMKDGTDERIMLYEILRSDSKPKDVEHQSDQHFFAEALRMLGDSTALKKLIAAFPNISFD